MSLEAPNLEGPRGIFPTSLYGQSAPGLVYLKMVFVLNLNPIRNIIEYSLI
jgi:hypothetical protein